MIAAFLESIKYVGHMWPVAILRILLGYKYLDGAIARIQEGYLEHAYISERLILTTGEVAASSSLYYDIFKGLAQTQWLAMTYVFIGIELIVGAAYLIGYCVRMAGILGLILSLHIFLFFDFPSAPAQVYLFYIHLLFLFLGAGRCLGLDYYFYKSRRGLLW